MRKILIVAWLVLLAVPVIASPAAEEEDNAPKLGAIVEPVG